MNLIQLAKRYYLVCNDRFELFFRGVVRIFDPYKYYIKASCVKGYTYKRYFTFTPNVDEVGEYELTIEVRNDSGELLETKSTILVVNDVKKVEKKTILCIGDSLTYNGVWPITGFNKYNELHPNTLEFIGKMKKDEIGYEGYGGWSWKTFLSPYDKSHTSSVWVEAKHNKTLNDQHSVWSNNNLLWIMETIDKGILKFKRGDGNTLVNPKLLDVFTHVKHGENFEDIHVDSYEYSDANPFINPSSSEFDFSYYLNSNGFKTPDYIFILLTWNGQYIPYNTDMSNHEYYINKMLDNILHNSPNTKIGLLGIQLPCCNGGMSSCYGSSGYYHDWFGETITAFNYNLFLEDLTYSSKYKDKVFYFDTKAQFDAEYNYYTKDEKVNNRCNVTERIGVNGIHPNMDGYLQLGDSFYRALIEMLKK